MGKQLLLSYKHVVISKIVYYLLLLLLSYKHVVISKIVWLLTSDEYILHDAFVPRKGQNLRVRIDNIIAYTESTVATQYTPVYCTLTVSL